VHKEGNVVRPVLFTIFGFPIRSYGFFIAVAFVAGLWLARRIALRRRPEHAPIVEDFALAALLAAIAGARIWEVAFTWADYRHNLGEIFAIWHGGLSIQGAVVGGGLVAWWFARKYKLSFWDFADTLTPGLLLGQAIGRLGSCFLNGDAYGKPTGTSFGVIYAPGSPAYDVFGPVRLWPAEVFEGLWDLVVLGLVVWMLLRKKQPVSGRAFLWYAVLYSVGRFSLEFLRADSLQFAGLKAAQVTSVLFAVGAGLLLLLARRQRPAPDPS
jgi:phosphatidylglycerol:prolipoprotein diacylglycerol transferase